MPSYKIRTHVSFDTSAVHCNAQAMSKDETFGRDTGSRDPGAEGLLVPLGQLCIDQKADRVPCPFLWQVKAGV